jgi:hypothetical protein
MECDQPTLSTWVVDSLHSHDFPDTELPSDEAILEVMASIDKPQEDEHHQESILPYFKLMRVITISHDSRPGAFVAKSSSPPSLDHFPLRISFSKLTTEFSTTPSIEESYFLPPVCLDGPHKGVFITHGTTHDEYLRLEKFVTMWRGPRMVCHLSLTTTHEFIDYEKYDWLEPSMGSTFPKASKCVVHVEIM